MSLPTHLVVSAVEAALAEDLGLSGDITTNNIIPSGERSSARIVARKDGRIAGLPLVRRAFLSLDPAMEIDTRADDGFDAAARGGIAFAHTVGVHVRVTDS